MKFYSLSRLFSFVIILTLYSIFVDARIYSKSIVISKTLGNKSPIDNYWMLYKSHMVALENKVSVDYTGIDSLDIEIPKDAIPIPIPDGCDFKGLKLSVTNKEKDFELFIIKNKPKKVSVTSTQIDNGDFRDTQELKNSVKLLAVTDTIPWIKERVGIGIPHFRKDMLLIVNGLSQDSTIQPYNDSISQPTGWYTVIEKRSPTVISNIQIVRSADSSYKTYCFYADYQYNLVFKNISILTPESSLFGDQAIRIRNSINVSAENITIKGTYSQKDKWGYGIALDNVRNSKFDKIVADGKWGIFGNNNIYNISVTNSDINRFDVHCYGKDAFLINTTFRNLRNLVSSFFGRIEFNKCTFINFHPLLIRDSYQVNTKFDVYFKDCQMEWSKRADFAIISTGKSISENPLRYSLKKIEWPNLNIQNTLIKSTYPQSILPLFNSLRSDSIVLDSDIDIRINGLFIDGFRGLTLSNIDVRTPTDVFIKAQDININYSQNCL